MNIRQLKIFQSIAIKESVSKAAEELYMSQPAVSHALKDLEDEVGMPLFERVGKRIRLNRKGKLFLEKVVETLANFDELEKSISLLDHEAPLRIASCITIAGFWLPQAVKQFELIYPKLPLHIEVHSAVDVLEKIRNNDVDIALYEGILKDDSLQSITFSEYELVFICQKEHPLSKKKDVLLNDILFEPLLLREKGSAVRDTFDALLQLHQLYMKPIWTSVNSQSLLLAVKQGLGISILPKQVVENFIDKEELHIFQLKDKQLKNETHIVYRKGTHLSESEEVLISILRANKKD